MLRYRRHGTLVGPLTRQMLLGTLPGVILGAMIRVFAVPSPKVFRLIVAALLLPLGLWLCIRTIRPPTTTPPSQQNQPGRRVVAGLAFAVGIVGGIYGIGGGSILGPILAARGLPVRKVAPAALATTFVTSIAGAVTFAALSLTTTGHVAPDWTVGLACGLGGLIGGYIGAHVQPHVPERALRLLLGALATVLAAFYLVQGFSWLARVGA